MKIYLTGIVYGLFLMLLSGGRTTVVGQEFVHPGLLQSQTSIERMKEAIEKKVEPIYADYLVFRDHPESQADYKMKGPMKIVGRNPTVGQGAYDSDANAAYQNALMWVLTGKHLYADKAIQIVNAWSATLDTITGRDAVLMAGLGPFKMVNAAELLRYSNAGWDVAAIRQTEKHFKEVIYPVISDFAPFANGNWDGAAEKTMMAIGIFCNDRAIFDRAINYYVDGWGDGSIYHYINGWGQCQESGRDQGHTQLGLAHLGDCCEIAWTQGLNLYSYADNRLLKGFEYTAKYNLGYSVKYEAELDRTGKYYHSKVSEMGRGRFRAIYAQIYSHYHSLMGMATPYTDSASEKVTPEPQGLPSADHTGFGNLFYNQLTELPAENMKPVLESWNKKPATPSGLILKWTSGQVSLRWVEVIGAESYHIQRATSVAGPFTDIADVKATASFIDRKTKKGTLYYYRIAAYNGKTSGEFCAALGIRAGLAKGWKTLVSGPENATYQSVSKNGGVAFNGKTYIFDVIGKGFQIFKDSSENHLFYYHALEGNGRLTFRYQPQISSQFSSLGILLRNDLQPNSRMTGFTLLPVSTKSIEEPDWQLRMFHRHLLKKGEQGVAKHDAKSGSENGSGSAYQGLNRDPAIVTYGRLTGAVWLRLEREADLLTGYSSKDGRHWQKVSQFSLPLKKKVYIGVYAASGFKDLSSVIHLDHLALEKAP